MKSFKPARPSFNNGFSTLELIVAIGFVVILVPVLLSALSQKIQNRRINHVDPPTVAQNQPDTTRPANMVFFKNAKVSLDLGVEWQQITSGPFANGQSICFPVLKGEGKNSGGLIQIFNLAINSDIKTAAEVLKMEVDAHKSTLKDTFKQDEFDSDYGVHGIHAYYDYKVNGVLTANTLRAHVYLLRNKMHSCIAIHYIAFAGKDSERVDQMIRDKLWLD